MAGGGIALAMTALPYADMAEIGQVRTTPFPWPSTAQKVNPGGQQQRQSEKQYKQPDEREGHDDDHDNIHIDEYA
jgi:hypothetical protein